jgi:hypothetical protein
MGHYEKLYIKIKHNPHNVMFDDLLAAVINL